MLAVLRLLFTERPLRQIFLERRSIAEDVAWAVLPDPARFAAGATSSLRPDR